MVLVPVALVSALAASIHGVVLAALEAVVLYGSLRFLQTTSHLGAIEQSLREGDPGAASRRLSDWLGEAPPSDEPGATARLAAEQGLRDAHHGTFAILFWYLVLPGPLGVVLYPLTQRAARLWDVSVDPDEREFGWFAGRAFEVLDWVPQRVTAFVFAIVGDFEDALFCWRSQAALWLRPQEGIVLASGAGRARRAARRAHRARRGARRPAGPGDGRVGGRGGSREPGRPALALASCSG